MITTAVVIITTTSVIITTAVGIDSHRGGNQFPPLAESQGTYAVGCCPVGCCPASVQWRHQPIFIGVQWWIRGVGYRGCAPPSVFSMIVIMLPPARSFVTYRCITCQALPVYSWSNYGCAPPPLEIPASAPGVARLRPL